MVQNEFIFSPLLLQQCFLGWLKKKCFVWQDVHFQNVILAAILLPHLAKALCMASSLYQTKHTLWTYNIFVFHYFISGWNRICPSVQAPVECVRYVARNGLCASCVVMAGSQCQLTWIKWSSLWEEAGFWFTKSICCGLNLVLVQNF